MGGFCASMGVCGHIQRPIMVSVYGCVGETLRLWVGHLLCCGFLVSVELCGYRRFGVEKCDMLGLGHFLPCGPRSFIPTSVACCC